MVCWVCRVCAHACFKDADVSLLFVLCGVAVVISDSLNRLLLVYDLKKG